MSSIRFQAIKMHLLPLFLISSVANHVSDFTRSAKYLERTVPRQIKLSGLRLVRFEQPNKVSFLKRFAIYFSIKIPFLSLLASHSHLRLYGLRINVHLTPLRSRLISISGLPGVSGQTNLWGIALLSQKSWSTASLR